MHRYSDAQVRWLQANAHRYSKRALARAFNRYFKRDQSAGAIGRKARALGLALKHSGPAYTGQFAPGRPHRPEAVNRKPNRTSFRPGHTSSTARPLGATRIDTKTGEILVRTNRGTRYQDPDGRTRAVNYFRPRRLIVWEALNGPVPRGHVVIRLDDDPTRDDPDALMLIGRGDLARLNQHCPLRTLPADRALRRAAVLRAQIHQRSHDRGAGLYRARER